MSDQHVVTLTPNQAYEMANQLMWAASHGHTVRVWVDGGGLKYSVNQWTWSYPPLGSHPLPMQNVAQSDG